MEAQPANITFGGHQTFSFRHGWLEKGFRAVDRAKDAFSAEDAIMRLGVGKNMLDSIKHWCVLAQLVEGDVEEDAKRSRGHRTTSLGRLLLDLADGWDPYLEQEIRTVTLEGE